MSKDLRSLGARVQVPKHQMYISQTAYSTNRSRVGGRMRGSSRFLDLTSRGFRVSGNTSKNRV